VAVFVEDVELTATGGYTNDDCYDNKYDDKASVADEPGPEATSLWWRHDWWRCILLRLLVLILGRLPMRIVILIVWVFGLHYISHFLPLKNFIFDRDSSIIRRSQKTAVTLVEPFKWWRHHTFSLIRKVFFRA